MLTIFAHIDESRELQNEKKGGMRNDTASHIFSIIMCEHPQTHIFCSPFHMNNLDTHKYENEWTLSLYAQNVVLSLRFYVKKLHQVVCKPLNLDSSLSLTVSEMLFHYQIIILFLSCECSLISRLFLLADLLFQLNWWINNGCREGEGEG